MAILTNEEILSDTGILFLPDRKETPARTFLRSELYPARKYPVVGLHLPPELCGIQRLGEWTEERLLTQFVRWMTACVSVCSRWDLNLLYLEGANLPGVEEYHQAFAPIDIVDISRIREALPGITIGTDL